MPAPNDLNSRIAKAKGWKLVEIPTSFSLSPTRHTINKWQPPNPDFGLVERRDLPDFTGTVEGVDGMMRELNQSRAEEAAPYYDWSLRWSALFQIWDFYGEDEITEERRVQFQSTKEEGSGVAVGRAYLSVFGKEADDVV